MQKRCEIGPRIIQAYITYNEFLADCAKDAKSCRNQFEPSPIPDFIEIKWRCFLTHNVI